MTRVIVTGATSLIGHFLLPKLSAAGYSVIAMSRCSVATETLPKGGEWRVADIGTVEFSESSPYALVHMAPLWLLPEVLHRSSSSLPNRIIAFSSTSRISKISSNNDYERDIANKLAEAEDDIARLAEAQHIPWTIFRPTLIYGAGLDKNISSIARFIYRFGFFPLVGAATGKRAPVHAEDLAEVCVDSLSQNMSYNKVYNLSGGEVLSYREMVERVFVALGKKPRYLPIPRWSLQGLLYTLSHVSRYAHLTPEMASRMNQDLLFDASSAKDDFGFCPRSFEPRRADFGFSEAS